MAPLSEAQLRLLGQLVRHAGTWRVPRGMSRGVMRRCVEALVLRGLAADAGDGTYHATEAGRAVAALGASP